MDDGTPVLLDIKPGIVKQRTDYAAEGRWTDSNLVRFNFGKPENWRGWQFASDAVSRQHFAGAARDILPWVDLYQRQCIGIATHKALYVWESGVYYNITPITTVVSASNILSTTSGSNELIVSITTHQQEVGNFVALVSMATTIGGNVLPAFLSTRFVYPITSVIDANSFKIEVNTTAAATSLSTGGNIDVEYLLAQGTKDYEFLYGYGTGTYGTGLYGITSGIDYAINPSTWSLDNWGENLIAVRRGGPIYIWQNDFYEAATRISAAPAKTNHIVVANEDRYLIAFGTEDSTSVFDPLIVRWCAREDYNDWVASIANTAGERRLSGGGSQIISARRSRGQILIWTDHDMYGMRFIGGDLVFSFEPLGESCGLIGPHAHVEVGGITYWMSLNRFHYYDGSVNILPCDVLDFIFENFDENNKIKIYAGVIPARNEIIWFYPTNDVDFENNRYVTYNVIEKVWAIGSLTRTVWSEDITFSTPLAVGVSGEGVFNHEIGRSAAGAAINSYIESAYFDVQEGKKVLHTSRIVPDFSNFDNTGRNEGNLFFTLRARNFPNQQEKQKGPFVVSTSVEYIDTRLRGRQFAFRLESNGTNNEWRMGNPLVYIQADGEH